MLEDSPISISSDDTDHGLAIMIDSIWGERAKRKEDFYEIVSGIIDMINSYSDRRNNLGGRSLSHFEESYLSIKQSNNRKTLLSRVESYLNDLEIIINDIGDYSEKDVLLKLEENENNALIMIKELYSFLGMKFPITECSIKNDKGIIHVYTGEQLRKLYQLVVNAYDKYRRCVEDNNMFAAFSSTSDYGTIKDYWYRWYSSLLGHHASKDDKNEIPQFDDVVEHMVAHNEQAYIGLLDEDFVPHVDAFWYGLEMLCGFIDHSILVSFNPEENHINDEEKKKIFRNIESVEFLVDERRILSAIKLKNQMVERLNALSEIGKE